MLRERSPTPSPPCVIVPRRLGGGKSRVAAAASRCGPHRGAGRVERGVIPGEVPPQVGSEAG
jgi:hypothetical protein